VRTSRTAADEHDSLHSLIEPVGEDLGTAEMVRGAPSGAGHRPKELPPRHLLVAYPAGRGEPMQRAAGLSRDGARAPRRPPPPP